MILKKAKLSRHVYGGNINGGPISWTASTELHAKDGWILDYKNGCLYVTKEGWADEVLVPVDAVDCMVRAVEQSGPKTPRKQSE